MQKGLWKNQTNSIRVVHTKTVTKTDRTRPDDQNGAEIRNTTEQVSLKWSYTSGLITRLHTSRLFQWLAFASSHFNLHKLWLDYRTNLNYYLVKSWWQLILRSNFSFLGTWYDRWLVGFANLQLVSYHRTWTFRQNCSITDEGVM